MQEDETKKKISQLLRVIRKDFREMVTTLYMAFFGNKELAKNRIISAKIRLIMVSPDINQMHVVTDKGITTYALTDEFDVLIQPRSGDLILDDEQTI